MATFAEDIIRDLAQYEPGKFNILLPKSVASGACPWIKPNPSIVEINPNVEAGDIYPVGGRDEEDEAGLGSKAKYGLAKPSIMRLANAAGISWDSADSRALSVSADYVAYKASGSMRGPDGSRMDCFATKEIDLRVIECEIRERKERTNRNKRKNWSPEWIAQMVTSELIQWRKNKLMRAETGAQERVVKALLAMRPAYTLSELALPFVVMRFDINFEHPDVQKLFHAQGEFAARALYGGRMDGYFIGKSQVINADAVVQDEFEEAPSPAQAVQEAAFSTSTGTVSTQSVEAPPATQPQPATESKPADLGMPSKAATPTQPAGQQESIPTNDDLFSLANRVNLKLMPYPKDNNMGSLRSLTDEQRISLKQTLEAMTKAGV